MQAFLPSQVSQRRSVSVPTTTISETTTDTWRNKHKTHHGRNSVARPTTILQDRRQLDQEIDENSRRKAKAGGGEVAAGAVLGGLIFGPFGK